MVCGNELHDYNDRSYEQFIGQFEDRVHDSKDGRELLAEFINKV